MSTKTKIAFACYSIAVFLMAALSVIYLLTPRLLPYQEAAIGTTWANLSPGLQVQFLSLMKVAGGGYLGTALALAILLYIPLRKGEKWARWAIPAIGIPAILIVNYAGLIVTLNTPGRPPLFAGPLVVILFIVGFFLSGDIKRRIHLSP